MKNAGAIGRVEWRRLVLSLLGCGVAFISSGPIAAEPVVGCREWYKDEVGGTFGPLFFQNGTISPRGGDWRSEPCSGSNADMFHVYTQAEINALLVEISERTVDLDRERQAEISELRQQLAERDKQVVYLKEEVYRLITDTLATVDAKVESLRAEVGAATR